jgi:hypothetical protein
MLDYSGGRIVSLKPINYIMAHFTLTSNYKLKSGYEIPILGFGVGQQFREKRANGH